MPASPEQLFERWVLAVVPKLRELPDGDGAFAALSMAFGLYERFLDSKINKEVGKATEEHFWNAGAKDLNVEKETFKRFWNGFRLGMQHAFQPKAYIERKGKGDKWGWEIAEGHGYNSYPVIVDKEGAFIITLDPWQFLQHTLNRWKDNPALMNELSEFQLGSIQHIPEELKQVAVVTDHISAKDAPQPKQPSFKGNITGLSLGS